VYVWSEGGRGWAHSIEDELIKLVNGARVDESLSQMIPENIITAINEVYLPKEETTFHEVYISG
jgi:hypothetical protein